jgi:magnesium-transporting ATPase (P-type)
MRENRPECLFKKSSVSLQEAPVSPLERMLMAMALCNSSDVELKDGELVYSASQPEELALVKALQKFGLKLVAKDLKGRMEFEVSFLGQSRKFRLLHLMDFTSDRKRMSVLIRDEQS